MTKPSPSSIDPTPGGEVTIIEGAFRGWTALVTHYFPTKERVRVLLSLLSREVEADVPQYLGARFARRAIRWDEAFFRPENCFPSWQTEKGLVNELGGLV